MQIAKHVYDSCIDSAFEMYMYAQAQGARRQLVMAWRGDYEYPVMQFTDGSIIEFTLRKGFPVAAKRMKKQEYIESNLMGA